MFKIARGRPFGPLALSKPGNKLAWIKLLVSRPKAPWKQVGLDQASSFFKIAWGGPLGPLALSKPGSMLAWIKLLFFKAPDTILSKPGSMLAWIKLLVFKAPDTITKAPDIKGILCLLGSVKYCSGPEKSR